MQSNWCLKHRMRYSLSLALSADGATLAVGAPWEDSSATGIGGSQTNNLASESGAVYVFSRTGATWSQQAYVKASNSEADDQFGLSVALSADGSTLAVAAPNEDSNATSVGGNQADNSARNSGAVYLFVRTGTAWSQQAYVKASNSELGDFFGSSLALSADGATLAVGAPSEDSIATGVGGSQLDNSSSDSGAVYVFSRTGTVWSQQTFIKASNTDGGDVFGSSVALSADGATLAVAARFEDSNSSGLGGNQADNSATDSGAVYVFVRTAAGWTQQQYVKASNADSADIFGFAVSLSSDGTLAVGASDEASNASGVDGNQNDNTASGSGAVYLY